MNRYVSVICIILAVLAALGFLAYNFLEIYDRDVYRFPSSEVRSNDFLALQRWIAENGNPVRTSSFTEAENILHIAEDVVVMDSSSFSWQEDTFNVLLPWIEKGKHLFVYHDYWQNVFYDEDFIYFVNHFDVKIITPRDEEAIPNTSSNESNNDAGENETDLSDQTSNDPEMISEDKNDFPALDQTIRFVIKKNRNDILFAGADEDMINLVHIPVGKGSVTFTGLPYFMQNYNLRSNENRLLTWNLTGLQDKDKQGILFIQENEFKNTFFQDLINEGNIFPLIISIFVLILVCFWGFIPRFGKVISDEESPGKSIRERFLGEAVFLKKFHSLSVYVDVYRRTIQQRFRKNYGEYIDDKKKFIDQLSEIVKLDEKIIEQALYPKGIITSRSFAKCMKTIEIILERL